MIETIILDNIVNLLTKHTLLLQSQYGITKGKSCLTNLLLYLEDVTEAIDESKSLDVIYLVFSKAFDKVPHQRLLLKIKAHGICGNVADWIVVLNGENSRQFC